MMGFSLKGQHRLGRNIVGLISVLFVTSCATVESVPEPKDAPVSRADQQQAQQLASQPQERVLKRKIAIGRFTNESRYGKSLLRDEELDPLGKQVADMLMARLVQSGKFLVFERNDLGRLEQEQAIIAGKSGKREREIDIERDGDSDESVSKISLSADRHQEFSLIGVDALILGSLTEFSRKTTGKSGFLSSTKRQIAEAKVEVRLADPLTGHAFFSASGSGVAESESGRVAGFGSKASYDGSLNDKAIAAAISDLIGALMTKLEEKPWQASVLKSEGNTLFISGGERQGLQLGDTLRVMKRSEQIQSSSGFNIDLPPTEIGKVKVLSFFGVSETNEGSVVQLIEGQLGANVETVFVAE